MSKVAAGSIPEKICYVFSEEKEVPVGSFWDIDWYSHDESKTIKRQVLPAFPSDNSDQGMISKAKAWAENRYYGGTPKISHTEIKDNSPIKNVQVLSLEQRGQGGRAYKIVADKYYVDLREDVLMDTMLKAGIKAGGILEGEFVWAKMGSQMRLVRVGSELHKLIIEFDSKKGIRPISKKELEVGKIYQDRKKNKALFCGYVNTMLLYGEKISWAFRDTNKCDFNFKKNIIKKAMLFYEIPAFEKQSTHLKEIKNYKSNPYFKVKKTHTYIESIGEFNVPNDILSILKERANKECKQFILEYTGHIPPKQGYRAMNSWDLQDRICAVSDFLHLSKYGEPQSEMFDVKKFLLFS